MKKEYDQRCYELARVFLGAYTGQYNSGLAVYHAPKLAKAIQDAADAWLAQNVVDPTGVFVPPVEPPSAERAADCPECAGSGNVVPGSGCTACGGTGKRKAAERAGAEPALDGFGCPKCGSRDLASGIATDPLCCNTCGAIFDEPVRLVGAGR